jgi:hypothetical protein
MDFYSKTKGFGQGFIFRRRWTQITGIFNTKTQRRKGTKGQTERKKLEKILFCYGTSLKIRADKIIQNFY